ncbi:hypothetical protein GUJ93_ZPchr0013g37627 [Zizania palustris]|uniref:Uncharacterized protein n=1 Tax=Zizania palustris TaxID=103762 RepID=A0A8J5WWJ8_ZIZPA|nr:hypothetical protein GUJ93_ZPchr0013g37627 [Zizania palustris]
MVSRGVHRLDSPRAPRRLRGLRGISRRPWTSKFLRRGGAAVELMDAYFDCSKALARSDLVVQLSHNGHGDLLANAQETLLQVGVERDTRRASIRKVPRSCEPRASAWLNLHVAIIVMDGLEAMPSDHRCSFVLPIMLIDEDITSPLDIQVAVLPIAD